MEFRKWRIMAKLKSFPQIVDLKQIPVSHLGSIFSIKPSPSSGGGLRLPELEDTSSSSKLFGDTTELEEDDDDEDSKENTRPKPEFKDPFRRRRRSKCPESILRSRGRFRRPDPDSPTLFDPDLLTQFSEAVARLNRLKDQSFSDHGEDDDDAPPPPPFAVDRSPAPGGEGTVILYTTSIQGIRKTFEECNRVRFLLWSSKVVFHERDISMHREFREEMWRALGGRAIPPRLFVGGRYIGGADEVLVLGEKGRLGALLHDGPISGASIAAPCKECGGMSFFVCPECHGSRKIYTQEMFRCCQLCNENGLMPCSICC